MANEEQQQALLDLYLKHPSDPSEKIRKVREIFSSLNIEEITKKEISDFYSNAVYFLDLLDVKEEKKSALRKMASELLDREF